MLARRWGTDTPVPPENCSTMCVVRAPRGRFKPNGDDANALCHALRERKVEVPVFPFHGALHVRISAQVYNSMADYERLADLVLELQGADG